VRTGKVIMFDLGGVLVENAGGAGLAAMLPVPLEPAELWQRWLASPAVRRFERGQIPSDEFACAFVEEWQLGLEPAAFLEAFAAWPRGLYRGAEALLRELRGRHHLACLSNTNSLHWQRLPQLQPLLASCRTRPASSSRTARRSSTRSSGSAPRRRTSISSTTWRRT
jgi:FMN phosphatase YigB (HAD superfamily)